MGRASSKKRASIRQPARYQLRIVLREVTPRVWRRLAVPLSITLDQLHQVVQAAFRWSDTHLHEFIIDEGRFGVPDPHYRDDDLMNELGVSLRELLEEGVGELLYLYDFGDGWVHQIDIETTLPADPALPALHCIAGENARPLEDIGGPSGHAQFLRAIADPRHPRHEEFAHWSGGAYDPRRFDIEAVNARLRGITI